MAKMSASKMDNLINNLRPGESISGDEFREAVKELEETNLKAFKGIQLSEIMFKPLEWFKYNPDNELFRECKTEEYFESLKKDIREANAILNPAIATPDGLLIEGESRHIISCQLRDEGLGQFGKLPCRIILSKIDEKKIKERLYLGNLSRFEMPHELKLVAYAEIWPGYFLASGDGREGNTVTTKKEIAAATGKSESQIKRDKKVIQEAAKIAKKDKEQLSAKHIKAAQKKEGAEPQDEIDHTKAFNRFFARRTESLEFALKFCELLNANKLMSKSSFLAAKDLIQEQMDKRGIAWKG